MGIFGSHPGSWFGLPDFGLTEKVGDVAGLSRNKQGGSELAYTPSQIQQMSSSVVNAPVVNWSPSQRQIVPSTGGGNNNSSVQGSSSSSSIRDLMLSGKIPWDDNILNASNGSSSNGVDEFAMMIENDYQSAIGGLNAQESNLRGQAQGSMNVIDSSYGSAATKVGEEQRIREQGLGEQETTANTSAASSLKSARQLFQETQQSNIAKLSGLGISSSSVSEAFAEMLGRDTASRIAGINSSRDEIINNIAKERTSVRTYYSQRVSDLEREAATQKASISQQLMAGIERINVARDTAQRDKSNRRAELLYNAQKATEALEKNKQSFEYSLKLWAMQQENSLQSAKNYTITSPDFNAIAKNLEGFDTSGLAQNYDLSGTINPKSGTTYNFKTKAKKDENSGEYDLEDPNSWQK